MEYIIGESREQSTMLPDCLDDYVGENNPVRVIDAYVDNLDMGALGFFRSEPNQTGRPMYSPKDMLKLYIYGYMNRIRSSRRLETESKRNLEVIWMMRKLSPDHKTIARFRQKNPNALKNVFRDFVKLCLKLDLYGKELVAIDGSKFKAQNGTDRAFTEKKLIDRIKRLDSKIEEYMQLLEESDYEETGTESENSNEDISRIVSELTQRKHEYEGYVEEIRQSEDTQKCLTDPDSRLMMSNGKIDVCFNVQTAIDSKNKMIVEFDVINRAQDKNQMGSMAKKAAEALEVNELNAVADAGYDSASDIAECLMNGITPHVARADIEICLPTDEAHAEKIESYRNGRCVYLRDRNIAICPLGQILYPGCYKKRSGAVLFYNTRACTGCTQKCTAERYKKFEIIMKRSEFHKDYNDSDLWVRRVSVKPDRELVSLRKCIVEHPFGTIKRAMSADHCLMRGIPKVSGEFALTFLAYNLKRAVNILGAKRIIDAVSL